MHLIFNIFLHFLIRTIRTDFIIKVKKFKLLILLIIKFDQVYFVLNFLMIKNHQEMDLKKILYLLMPFPLVFMYYTIVPHFLIFLSIYAPISTLVYYKVHQTIGYYLLVSVLVLITGYYLLVLSVIIYTVGVFTLVFLYQSWDQGYILF